MVGKREDDDRKSAGRSASNGKRHRPPTHAIGWEHYRGWVGSLGHAGRRRQGSKAVYTWQGYQAWAAKVRANWDPDEK